MADERPSTLVELAEQILEQARKLENSVKATPTFQYDTLAELPLELEPVRRSLVDTAEILASLARGSVGVYSRIHKTNQHSYPDLVALQVVHYFRIPHRVPLEGSISFADLADQCNVGEDHLTRLLRLAMSNFIFCEPVPGYVAHTADSRQLLTDPTLMDYVGMVHTEHSAAALKVCDALEKWPDSEELTQTPYHLAHGADEPFYQYLAKYPERLRQFGSAMRHLSRVGVRSAEYIARGYPWGEVSGGTVVDLGGGNGQISVTIAKAFPDIKFIVQDLPGVSDAGIASLPASLRDRVKFQTHSVLEEQPVKDADVYLFAKILHNFPDKYCVAILRQLVPALKSGARILVCDRVLPEKGEVLRLQERDARTVDLVMMMLMNAKERTEAQLRELFTKADSRFVYKGRYRLEGGVDNICEAVWMP